MNITSKVFVFISILFFLPSVLAEDNKNLTEHQKWLKDTFAEQHNQLIPVVAVANMFFACNQDNNQKYGDHALKVLITKMDKAELAEKLSSCLAGESVNSEVAINYGLMGCFDDQLSGLSADEKKQRMVLVTKAINSLSFAEKKQSFTQCVTDQAISYLT